MSKYLVETYYTCTFKTVHTLDNLNEVELSKIDKRTDGEVKIIDVKLNNRKTKKIGEEKNNNKKKKSLKDKIKKYGITMGLSGIVIAGIGSEEANVAAFSRAGKNVEGTIAGQIAMGDGQFLTAIDGTKASDEINTDENNNVTFKSNHSGAILGGISSGQDIEVSFVVKPTSSILTPKDSVDTDGNNIKVQTKGRHDPCVGIRAVPVGEAMLSFTLADLYLAHKAQVGAIN